jgi:hypothetical protein
MAVQIMGNSGIIPGTGEEASKPIHVVNAPNPGNTYRYSGHTGTLPAALAANSEVLQFRFVTGTKSYALIHKVRFDGMGMVAAATAAGPIGFELVPARAWSTAGSGGNRISTAGDNLQTVTSISNSQVSDIGIANTLALGVGVKTLDTNAQGGVLAGVGTAAITAYTTTSLIPPWDLFDSSEAGYQSLKLADKEGFVVRTTHVGPAGLTYTARFTIVWSEVTDF